MSASDATTTCGFCVIMAGGRGTRFWPLSRTDRPKQMLPLATDLASFTATTTASVSSVSPTAARWRVPRV